MERSFTSSEVRNFASNAARAIVNWATSSDVFSQGTVYLYYIPQGGAPIAYAVASYLKEDFEVHVRSTVEYFEGSDARPIRVLVDDIVDSGKSMNDEFDAGHEYDLTVAMIAKRGLIDLPSVAPYAFIEDHEWATFPWEPRGGPADAVRRIIQWAGDDPDREGLAETPLRFLNFLQEWKTLNETEVDAKTFPSNVGDLVVVKDVAFYSLCEHHLLPYHGVMHVGYIPHGSVLGLSKIPRIIRQLSSRFTIQEGLTHDVANSLATAVGSFDVAVVSQATHTCSMIRGVRVSGMEMQSSAMLGSFREGELRAEFLSLIR